MEVKIDSAVSLNSQTTSDKESGRIFHKQTEPLVRFDWAMKTLLRDKANFPVLEGFLSELLGDDVQIDSLLESESNKKDEQDKSNRVDLAARLKSGEQVIIEVQCARQWDFLSRMLYGVSKVVVEHIKEGEAYSKIPKVISVNILYFDLGEGDGSIFKGTTQFHSLDGHGILRLSEKEKKCYPNLGGAVEGVFPEYYILKVNQFNHDVKSTLDEWVYFFKNSEIKANFTAKGIQVAAQKLRVMQLPLTERERYDQFVDNIRSEKSILETYLNEGFFLGKNKGIKEGLVKGEAVGLRKGIAKGRSEGKAEGKAEGKIEMIRGMHQAGCSLDQIIAASGMAKDEVEVILK